MAANRVSKRTSKAPKKYRFQLSLSGIAGIGVVCFCIFLWMFLLGIWAGQTILLPSKGKVVPIVKKKDDDSVKAAPLQTVLTAGKKKPVSH